MNKIIIINLLQHATSNYNLKYLFFNFNKRKNMSCPNLGSSSTRTPKNTNPDLKHENTCPDFLAFFLPFLVNQTQTQINFQQEYKHKPNSRSSQIFSNHKTQIYKITTQTQIFSSFNQPQKPLANKIHKPRNQIHKPKKFSIKTPLKKKIINSKAPILKPKQHDL